MPDYAFYTGVYGGDTVPEGAFDLLVRRAGDILDRYKRYYRVHSPAENAEEMAICAMAEELFQLSGGEITRAAIGSVSVSYAAPGLPERERRLYRAAGRYLDIYRGVG